MFRRNDIAALRDLGFLDGTAMNIQPNGPSGRKQTQASGRVHYEIILD